ncbi:lactonase family protein [Cellulosimicrobium marinum]|uniref:lactonase family protein n=1 Tax=Cellulosimicrobium marinum TaxID=1638992 RepID=UPI001E633205|nr:beta-propeller fold lactonase family protein [Cellulosimicrobium marinum]MCB7136879.1 lactonase family protein [Cellulosimicrobium marinum]
MTVATRALWIGTYPHPASADPEGVWRVELDTERGVFVGGVLVAPSPSPSFLALGPSGDGPGAEGGTLYAVEEAERGTVTAFAVTPDGGLAPRGPAVPTGGAHPCHVVARATEVLVANYGDGVLTVASVDGTGALVGEPRGYGHAGSGPDGDRQGGPHAHFVADDGRDGVLVVDLGTDEVRRHDPGAPAGTPGRVVATLPPGTGPRHLAALPGGHLVVVGELDPALFVLAPAADGTYDVVARYPAAHAAAPAGGRSYPSHVSVTADGARVVVAVRGADVLAVHAVDAGPQGAPPALRHLADTPVGGAWPRHHAVLRPTGDGEPLHDLVVVANQNDDPLIVRDGDPVPGSNLALLRVRRSDGLGEVLDVLALPAPACVVEA